MNKDNKLNCDLISVLAYDSESLQRCRRDLGKQEYDSTRRMLEILRSENMKNYLRKRETKRS